MTTATRASKQSALLEIEQELARRRLGRSFWDFLPLWQFVDRETGEVRRFDHETLWQGQRDLAATMMEQGWLVALKAGKLGFTELECAYDGWVALFRQANARVHLFSRDGRASKDLLGYVRFGLEHLPDWLQPQFLEDMAGGFTSHSLKFQLAPDDVRSVVSYAAGPHIGIDTTASHSHVDELAHMPFPEATWNAISTTVAPGGSCHIISRGAGEDNFLARLWEMAQAGNGNLYPFFAPWSARADRDRVWYDVQSGKLTPVQLDHFAPETVEDALSADSLQDFVPSAMWGACREDHVKPLQPGERTPIVLAVDAGTTSDNFGIVAVCRCPLKPDGDWVDLRAVRKWVPPRGGAIDYSQPEAFLRMLILGGCPMGHPLTPRRDAIDERFSEKQDGQFACPSCRDGVRIPAFNVLSAAFDSHQLVDMMQRLRRENIVTVKDFDQTKLRLKSDRSLYNMILNREIHHDGNEAMRQHIQNAAAKVQKDEDSKLRLVKKAQDRKIDLAVCLSMAAYWFRRQML